MYGRYLSGILMIFLDHRLTSQITHRYDMVCIVHTILLNRIDIRIHISAATIVIRSMNMDYLRLTTHIFSVNTRRISQPVMRMDDIILFRTSDYSRNDRIVINLFQKIIRITSGELKAT